MQSRFQAKLVDLDMHAENT